MTTLTSAHQPIEVSFLPSAELPLSGRIGFTWAPGRKGHGTAGLHDRDLDADLARLRREYGVMALVSLVTEKEAVERVHVPIEVARRSTEKRGMSFHHAPVEAGSLHPDDELVDLIQLLRDQVELGQTLVVHDRSGSGRAATVCAALLVAQGRSPDEAIATVRSVRPKAIEPSQEMQLHRIAGRLAERSAPLFAVVTEAFEQRGWKHERVPGTTLLRSGFDQDGTKLRLLVATAERREQVVVLATLPIGAPEATRPAVAELLARINWDLVVGAFEMNFDDGTIRYRTAIDVEGGRLTTTMVHSMATYALVSADRAVSAIASVAFAGVEPVDALADPEPTEAA